MGPYDANFHNGRLRISAYLRTVGEGLPRRPRRSNRRRAIVEADGQTSKERDNTENSVPCLPSESKAVDMPPSLPDASDEKAKEIQHSTPSSRHSPSPNPESSPHHQQEESAKSPIKNQGSSQTRKRRLPVNQLALLRTTSSQGLPDPGDKEIASAPHVTDSDPIEDSQNIAFTALRNRPITPASHKLSSRQENKSNPACFTKKITCRLRNLPKQDRNSESRLNFESVSDGFVGTEMITKPVNRQYVPRKKAKVEPKKKSIVKRELALVFGTLPGPTKDQDEDLQTLLPMDRSRSGRAHIQSKLAHTMVDVAQPIRPMIPLSRRSAKADEYLRDRLPQEEELVRNQLACVTAPLRQDSDSSASELSEEERSSEDDDDSNAEASSRSRSMESINAPSEFDETTYFEEAMYNLGVTGTTSSAREFLWSQCGTMR